MSAVSSLVPSDLAPGLLIGDGVTIADDVEIGPNVVIHDGVSVGPGARLDVGAVLGRSARLNRRSRTVPVEREETVIEAGATVCAYALVGAGVRMAPHSLLGDHAHLREGARLGTDTMVGAGCGIGRNVEIGDRTRVQNQSVVGPNVVIESDCFLGPAVQILTGRTMGKPARATLRVLRRGCQIGAGAMLMPGVEIGEEAVVGAGAVVVGDVAPGSTVKGVPAREAYVEAG
jgi:acetyltransferase-like isoleucine patch superfamily enzyme